MRIRFHIRMAVISKLSSSCIALAVLMFLAMLICVGKPLDLSHFFPSSFAQFFLWICAFPLLTVFSAIGAVADLNSLSLFRFMALDSMQMASIGILALLTLLIFWAFSRYAVLKLWGTDWVKAATTIVRCFVIWGAFQILCVFISYAWIVGGFNIGKNRHYEDVKQVQTVIPEDISS